MIFLSNLRLFVELSYLPRLKINSQNLRLPEINRFQETY